MASTTKSRSVQDIKVNPQGSYHDNVNVDRSSPGEMVEEITKNGQGMKLVDHLEGIEEENLFHQTKPFDPHTSPLEFALRESFENRRQTEGKIVLGLIQIERD